MARILGAPRNQGRLFRRALSGSSDSLSRRRLGRVVMPVQVTAHHPKTLWGYGQMEQSQAGSKLVDPKLKGLPRALPPTPP